MPVPFRDLRDDEERLAGFLRFVRESSGLGIRGALFVVNARGEPVSFTYTRADLPTSLFWRAREAHRHSIASLAATLLAACPESPAMLLTLAEEVPDGALTGDLRIQTPLGQIAAAAIPTRDDPAADAPRLTWHGQPPGVESSAHRVVEALLAHGLLLEPFERAASGLDEAYREHP